MSRHERDGSGCAWPSFNPRATSTKPQTPPLPGKKCCLHHASPRQCVQQYLELLRRTYRCCPFLVGDPNARCRSGQGLGRPCSLYSAPPQGRAAVLPHDDAVGGPRRPRRHPLPTADALAHPAHHGPGTELPRGLPRGEPATALPIDRVPPQRDPGQDRGADRRGLDARPRHLRAVSRRFGRTRGSAGSEPDAAEHPGAAARRLPDRGDARC